MGLAAAFQGYWGKQEMGNGNNLSGEVLQPLCVWWEAALRWQRGGRAAATADPTAGVIPTPAAPGVSGVCGFLLGQLHQQVNRYHAEGGRSQRGLKGCDKLGRFFELYPANTVFDMAFIHANLWISLSRCFSRMKS